VTESKFFWWPNIPPHGLLILLSEALRIVGFPKNVDPAGRRPQRQQALTKTAAALGAETRSEIGEPPHG
jgi:hypothetical protein